MTILHNPENYKKILAALKNSATKFKVAPEDKEDVIQDVLLEFFLKDKQGRIIEEKNICSYAAQIFRWRIKEKIRNGTRRKILFEQFNSFDEETHDENPFSVEILDRALEDVRGNKKTNPTHWSIFWHCYKNDNVNETAKHFGVDRSVVDVVNYRIKRKIIKRAREIINQ